MIVVTVANHDILGDLASVANMHESPSHNRRIAANVVGAEHDRCIAIDRDVHSPCDMAVVNGQLTTGHDGYFALRADVDLAHESQPRKLQAQQQFSQPRRHRPRESHRAHQRSRRNAPHSFARDIHTILSRGVRPDDTAKPPVPCRQCVPSAAPLARVPNEPKATCAPASPPLPQQLRRCGDRHRGLRRPMEPNSVDGPRPSLLTEAVRTPPHEVPESANPRASAQASSVPSRRHTETTTQVRPGRLPIIVDTPSQTPGLGFGSYAEGIAAAALDGVPARYTIGLYGPASRRCYKA